MSPFLVHHRNEQARHICDKFWNELRECIVRIADGSVQFYDNETTVLWMVQSVRLGFHLAELKAKEAKRR
jgi:hypothetical protein